MKVILKTQICFPALFTLLVYGIVAISFTPVQAQENPSPSDKLVLDRSGQPQKGEASYYGEYFYGRTMADGTPMDPDAPIAASRTLPLGSLVEVTNLENGKSEVVEIRDRGPYIAGRIIDLSPKVAKQLGMLEKGVAQVVVTPLEVPQADGTLATGSSSKAQEASAAK